MMVMHVYNMNPTTVFNALSQYEALFDNPLAGVLQIQGVWFEMLRKFMTL